ncbi:hypothetical protein FQN57_005600 [Myotisia sp. PD_48]|nr:hypothetical protein FQN57_005600 [Myotisia sp. PD_48]
MSHRRQDAPHASNAHHPYSFSQNSSPVSPRHISPPVSPISPVSAVSLRQPPHHQHHNQQQHHHHHHNQNHNQNHNQLEQHQQYYQQPHSKQPPVAFGPPPSHRPAHRDYQLQNSDDPSSTVNTINNFPPATANPRPDAYFSPTFTHQSSQQRSPHGMVNPRPPPPPNIATQITSSRHPQQQPSSYYTQRTSPQSAHPGDSASTGGTTYSPFPKALGSSALDRSPSSHSSSPSSPFFRERASGHSLPSKRSKELLSKSISHSELRQVSYTNAGAVSTSPTEHTTRTPNPLPTTQASSPSDMAEKRSASAASSSTTTGLKLSSFSSHKAVPRTSSIDSALSSLSTHSHKSSLDVSTVTPADIANLINTAGSPEALIIHLLKEKQQAISQNAQLWKLVDKQRTMVLALNKDLERTVKDKDRYRKKLKELQNLPATIPDSSSVNRSDSKASDASGTVLSQKHSQQMEALALRQRVLKNAEDGLEEPEKSVSEPEFQRDDTSRSTTRDLDESERSSPSETLHPEQTADQNRDTPSPKNLHQVALQKALESRPPSRDVNLNNSNTAATPSQPGTPPAPARRPPPAPLQLAQSQRLRPHIQVDRKQEPESESDYDDLLEDSQIPNFERGRRKTREEDDQLREAMVVQKEKELRSRSNKKKPMNINPPESVQKNQLEGFPGMGLPASPRAPVGPLHAAQFGARTGPSDSLAAMISTERGTLDINRLASPPMTPGLPQSPRPGDRPLGSPTPRLPRDGAGLFPSIPGPTVSAQPRSGLEFQRTSEDNDSTNNTSVNKHNRPNRSLPETELPIMNADIVIDSPTATRHKPRNIFRGLVSDEYPDLLLPPNSLPSIEIKVASSRLRPSRNSYMALKPTEEEPVFTLSVFSRSNRSELWRVEKAILALPQLDQQIKQVCKFAGRIPERSIFSGHAPAKVDARRAALNSYFEALLDTPMDDKAALVICHFLTQDAIEPRDDETSLVGSGVGDPDSKPYMQLGSDGKPQMEGYLTKRGKNFGGWKSRYFVLQGPELKYYESPGGAHLGTIKIHHAQIGKQSQSGKNQSPSRADDDVDNQYRHAFLILEPKKKDSSALVRHVLCTESDEERDAWVDALLSYVEHNSEEEEQRQAQGQSKSDLTARAGAASQNKPRGGKKGNNKGRSTPDSSEIGANYNTLRALSYDDVVAAEAPIRGHNGAYSELDLQTPMSPSFKPISAPSNGVKIQDASAWGNKPPTATSLKEKKRSIWGFARPGAGEAGQGLNSNASLERKEAVRAVFGLPLAEAVEFCSCHEYPDLPAVVYRCLEYLRSRSAEFEEGIFRLSGSNVVIKALKERFNTEGDLDFLDGDHYYDVHAVASLFKQYLRELPTTVLTKELHLDFIRVLDLDDKRKRVAAFHHLVHKLPPANISLLKALSEFLIIVVNNADVNKMTVRNVGIVFAPTLNIPAPVFSTFLSDFDVIFGDDLQLEIPSDPVEVVTTTNHNNLTPEDIRSPRHQMFSDLPSTPAYDQGSFRGRVTGAGSENQSANNENGQNLRSARENYDTGFVPVHPNYDQQTSSPSQPLPQRNEHNYATMDGMLAAPAGNQPTSKNKRRESSLLFMSIGNRKSSMPKIRDD